MHDSMFPLLLAVVLAARVGLHFLDRNRVRLAASLKGWQDIDVRWAPFGPGWFFLKQRQYRVTYLDPRSIPHEQYAITSLFTDVYWKDEEHPSL